MNETIMNHIDYIIISEIMENENNIKQIELKDFLDQHKIDDKLGNRLYYISHNIQSGFI